METKTRATMDETQARKLADTAFRFLLQMDMVTKASGIANAVIYGPKYNESLWSNPSHWLKAAVLDQYTIVGSRIALECFFDLIYTADRRERMPGKSKFKTFRKWVVIEGNPYKYFVGHIIKAFEFDREHRQREVHGTSQFAQKILRLEMPDSTERNTPLILQNVLINTWGPLVQTMNNCKPSSISVFEGLGSFSKEYFDSINDSESFDQFIQDIVDQRLSGG